MRQIRPAPFCRSWLFLEGANEQVLRSAASSGADVLIQELEDFTPPHLRPSARALAADLYAAWREAGAVVAVRVNPLDADGMDDLAAVMRGRPDIVALPKVAKPAHVISLDEAVTRFERDYGIAEGSTALLPNIEFARGLIQTAAIAKSPRIVGCLMASEDLANDLGAERGPDGVELAYCRQRFIVECTAAGVVAVDCPYTFSDVEGLARDVRWARRLGYVAKASSIPRMRRLLTRC
jgi:citrate lyase subunit beta/citryl-CoA lyase